MCVNKEEAHWSQELFGGRRNRVMTIMDQKKFFRFFLPAFVLLLFLFRLIDGFLPGVLLAPTPDSVEPFAGALRMCRGENYGFMLNGEYFPSRYSPALSFLLLPFLYFSPVPGAAGIAIGFWSMVLMLFVILLFHKDREYGGTALACGLLFCIPCFLEYCGSAMTEIPYAALLFIMFWLYRKMLDSDEDSPKLFLLYGIAAAVCGSLRMTGYPMLLAAAWILFFRCRQKRTPFIRSWLFLLLPSGITASFSLLYNQLVFGSPLRSGYHFHTPVPHDFPQLLFSFSYIPGNIRDALTWGLRGAIIVGITLLVVAFHTFLCKRKSLPDRHIFRAECGFVFLQFAMLLLLYLPYCYSSMRFYFPGLLLFVWLLVRGLLGVIRALKISNDAFITGAAWMIGLEIIGITIFQPQLDYCGQEIKALCHLEKILPERALLIHNYDPGRVELFFVGNSGRKQLPVTRKCEYADKIALKKSIRDPDIKPKHALDHRAEYLHEAPGKIIFFKTVLEEAPQKIIEEALARKEAVFITGDSFPVLSQDVYFTLRRQFRMQRAMHSARGSAVFRILPR